MGVLEEQIKYREIKDFEGFENSLNAIASTVIGVSLVDVLNSKKVINTAIKEVLKYYHFRIEDDEVIEELETFDEQMDYYLRYVGISRRRVVLDENWYKNSTGPLIGVLKKDNRVVALLPRAFGRYYYNDYETGKRININKNTAKIFKDEAICFYKPLPLKSLSIKDFYKFIINSIDVWDKETYVLSFVFVTILGMGLPIFVNKLFGSILRVGLDNILFAYFIFMISFIIFKSVMMVLKEYIGSNIILKQNTRVTAALVSRVISLPASFFEKYSSGDLSQRILNFKELFSSIMGNIYNMVLVCILSVIYIFQVRLYAKCLILPSWILFLLMLFSTIFIIRARVKINKKKFEFSTRNVGFTYSIISGIQKIKLVGAERRMFAKWANKYSEQTEYDYNPPLMLKLSKTIIVGITLLSQVVIYYIAWINEISSENFYSFITIFAMVVAAFTDLSNNITLISTVKPIIDSLKPILDEVPEIYKRKKVIAKFLGEIELHDVSFGYNKTPPYVINKLSLKINKGEYVAIVGSTGCGKSTLVKLLLGFEKPQSGNIYYDNNEISNIDLKSLRKNIGVVLQNDKLFVGDILSNIIISSPKLTIDDAWEAAKIASIDEDIKEMPMGMYTYISEGQGGISGGQKQRLFIARAIATKPNILIFDEATSALDNITQKQITDALNKLDCTRIVIAHRLSTIVNCDRILVLDKGNVAEEGTYKSLIEKKGIFYELVERQRLEG